MVLSGRLSVRALIVAATCLRTPTPGDFSSDQMIDKRLPLKGDKEKHRRSVNRRAEEALAKARAGNESWQMRETDRDG